MVILGYIIMFVSLILQGLYFWARDAVTPDLPPAFLASDLIWGASFLSLLLYRRYPWVTIAFAWALLLMTAVVLAPFSFDHTLRWFFVTNSLTIANLVSAHVGWYLKRKRGLSTAEE